MTSDQPAAQTAGAVLMIRPQSFGWNPETGPSNRFQVETGEAPLAVSAAASSEFTVLSSGLRAAGIEDMGLITDPRSGAQSQAQSRGGE